MTEAFLRLLFRWLNALCPSTHTKGRESLEAYVQVQQEKASQLLDDLDRHFPLNGRVVVDLGCGPGGIAYFLSQKGAKVIGIDVTLPFLKHAVSYGEDALLFVGGDAHALPIKSGSIDLVLVIDAIEHVSNPRQVIGECCRVLKKGGLFFAAFPPFYSRLGHHLYDYVNIPWAHLLFPSKILAEYWKRSFKRASQDGSIALFPFTPDEIEKKGLFEQIFQLNRMTIRNFDSIMQDSCIKEIFREEYSSVPPLLCQHFLREMFVDYIVYLGVKK